MFHMVNECGNVHKLVKSEHKRDELIALGYHEVKEPVETPKPKKGTTKKSAEEE